MRISRYTVLTLLMVAAVAVEVLSALEWVFYPYFPDRALVFARLDATIFSLLAPFSPAFLILLLYTWPVRLAISLNNQFSNRLKSYFSWLVQPLSQLRSQTPPNSEPKLVLTNHPRLVLLLAVAVALLLGLIPYRPDLNPSMTPIGVDAHFYIESVNQMLQRSPSAAVSYAMGNVWAGSRPLILLPMYLTVATGLISVNQAIAGLPLILGPILAMSTFVFVREGYRDERVAGLASLFSVLSFSTTVGMWAGFYANWLALAEAYLFLAVLLGFLRTASSSKFIILTVLSISLLLTHPWTWSIVLAITGVFILSIWRDDRKTGFVKTLAVLLAISVVVDLVKSQVFGGLVAAQETSTNLFGSVLSQSPGFWQNLINGLFATYSGLLSNAILLGLPMIAMLLLRFRDRFERLLTLWIALGSVPFLFVESLAQTRIIYDLPLPALTSLSLLLLVRRAGGRSASSNLAVLLVLVLSANHVLQALTNLVTAPF